MRETDQKKQSRMVEEGKYKDRFLHDNLETLEQMSIDGQTWPSFLNSSSRVANLTGIHLFGLSKFDWPFVILNATNSFVFYSQTELAGPKPCIRMRRGTQKKSLSR